MIAIIFCITCMSCASVTEGQATQPVSRPTWLKGKRVAVCGDYNYDGVIAATENTLRQYYGVVIVSIDCRNISGIDYLAVLEVVRSYSEARIWLKIVGDRGQIGAIGYGESSYGYAAASVRGRNNYVAGYVSGNRDRYNLLRMAAEEAVRDLH